MRINYSQGQQPIIRVVKPPLLKHKNGDKIPHVFPGDKLCLYSSGEWSNRDSIARTIVPWTSLWLFYYELWHATGKWLGGGHEPVPVEEDSEISS